MDLKRAALSFLLLSLIACSDKTPPDAQVSNPAVEGLASETVALSTVERELRFDGVIEALNQATVTAQTAGRIVELPVDVGDYVEKGQLILQMTDTEQKARVASAQAALDAAHAQLTDASAQFKRMQDLFAKQLIAKAAFDQTEAAFKSARARTEAAEAAVQEAQQQLDYTRLHAPYSGIVLSRAVKVGESVAPGTPLMTGLSLEQLRVRVDIPQQHIGPVRKFKHARIPLASGVVLDTIDMRIPPGADAQSHSFPVLVNLPEGDHQLFPGTLIKVGFVVGAEERLLIPAGAVAQRGEINGVYIKHDQRLEFRHVDLGSRTSDNRYPVLAGLNVGEVLVLDPVAAAGVYKQSPSTGH